MKHLEHDPLDPGRLREALAPERPDPDAFLAGVRERVARPQGASASESRRLSLARLPQRWRWAASILPPGVLPFVAGSGVKLSWKAIPGLAVLPGLAGVMVLASFVGGVRHLRRLDTDARPTKREDEKPRSRRSGGRSTGSYLIARRRCSSPRSSCWDRRPRRLFGDASRRWSMLVLLARALRSARAWRTAWRSRDSAAKACCTSNALLLVDMFGHMLLRRTPPPWGRADMETTLVASSYGMILVRVGIRRWPVESARRSASGRSSSRSRCVTPTASRSGRDALLHLPGSRRSAGVGLRRRLLSTCRSTLTRPAGLVGRGTNARRPRPSRWSTSSRWFLGVHAWGTRPR